MNEKRREKSTFFLPIEAFGVVHIRPKLSPASSQIKFSFRVWITDPRRSNSTIQLLF